jgi:hypothetical protein
VAKNGRLRPTVLLLPWVWAGCDLDSTCDPAVEECVGADSGLPFTGDTEVARVTWGCCEPGEDRCDLRGTWWVDVLVEGEASEATLSMTEAAGLSSVRWSETHAVSPAVSDDAGWWEDRYLELPVARTSDCATLSDCSDKWVAGENTLFSCAKDPDAAGITLIVRVTGDTGAQLGCVAWGRDASSVLGCETIE